MQEEIRLSAEVYDKLKAEAEKHGGIGKVQWYAMKRDGGYDLSCPVCINGMAVTAGLVEGADASVGITEDSEEQFFPSNAIGISYGLNDWAVNSLINRGKFTVDEHGEERVSWDDYVTELNIEREPEEVAV